MFSEKIQQHADTCRQRSALAGVDRVEGFAVVRITLFKNRLQTSRGDVIPYCKGGQTRQSKAVDRQPADGFAVARLNAPGRADCYRFVVSQKAPGIDFPRIVEPDFLCPSRSATQAGSPTR